MPKSLLHLELLLSEGVVDLGTAANIIRGDLGLTIELLRLATREIDGWSDSGMSVSGLVVLAGVERLRALVRNTASIASCARSDSHCLACERFWRHASLTALVAEDLAGQTSDVPRDEAFLAGMFYHLGDLPLVLDWDVAGEETRDLRNVVSDMAKAWNLPTTLVDVIRQEKAFSSTARSDLLLDLASTASNWAYRFEFLTAR